MSDDRMTFDGTIWSMFALFEWAGQRFPMHERDEDRITWIAVTNPDTPIVQRAYPGDTIVRSPDGVLTVETAART